jgi:hypothetical protein
VRRSTLAVKVSSRISRKALRKGVAVRLTANRRMRVVVTLRGPGRTVTRRTLTLKAGTLRLKLRPRGARAARSGRKLTLVVRATSSEGTRITRHRTIRIR